MTDPRDFLAELLRDFTDRASRAAGTPSEWYWREAARAVRLMMEVRRETEVVA